MKKLLLVIDMQNDFISGTLGTPEAQAIVSKVKALVESYKEQGQTVLFTRDSHGEDYLTTQEGKYLPVIHCTTGTPGHEISGELDSRGCRIFDKPHFGSWELAQKLAEENYDEIELCGICTDICVVSNALLLKALLPETPISVRASCCAGVTPESHQAALLTMKMCQINII